MLGMKIYISGAITGDPNYYDKFKEAEQTLKEIGFDVINPADNKMPPNTTWEQYMQVSITQLAMCEAIYMLKGWEQSKGATIEKMWAEGSGKLIYLQDKAKAKGETL